MLAFQNGRLRQDMAELRYRSIRPQAGDFVPSFTAPTVAGDTVRVVTGSVSGWQVLLVFTTTCQYCEQSIPAWNGLVRTLAAEGTPVLGISLDPLDETRRYQEAHGLEYPVIRFPHENYRRMYRANTVPITMVIDGGGRIVYARMGVIERGVVTDSVLAAVRWRAPAQTDTTGSDLRNP